MRGSRRRSIWLICAIRHGSILCIDERLDLR
jgi:hypothetical protein